MDSIQERIASLTPEGRALLEQRLMRAAAGTGSERIPRRAEQGPSPLSFAQQRLWFLDQLLPGGHAYNTSHALRIQGALQVDVLRRALQAIARRHETLRTVFVAEDGVPLQGVMEDDPFALPVRDLRDLPAGERELEMRRDLEAEIARPFDLAHGPPCRARLIRLGDRDHALLLVVHHIVFDGWSLGVFLRELGAHYEAFVAGQPSPLSPLPIQYADYSVWQRSRLTGALLDSELAYWKQSLAGAPAALELPTDRPRPAVWTGRGRRHRVEVAAELVDGLTSVGRQERATLFMTLLAAFQTLLFRYTRQSDVVVGTALAGRPRTELEGLIGLFARTLALRTDLSGDPSFREILARVREVSLGAYAHQELPFEQLVENLSPERSMSHAPVFQAMFLLQNMQHARLALPGLEVTPLETDHDATQVDLTVSLTLGSQGLRGRLEYSTDLFDASTIARLGRHYETLLRGIVASPDRRLSALPLLPDGERRQVLVEWNATAAEYPREACVHHLIEAQVQRTPDAVAVVCDGRQLTYGELDARAGELAGRLRAEGVGSETLVGICVDRSLEMVVGALGILKAGGAYVPLDPAHPLERLGFVLADADVQVLVTEERRRSRFERAVPRIVCLGPSQDASTLRTPEVPTVGSPDHLAYVMYTSGSTGRPKGVAVTHRSVVNVLHAMRREPGLTAQDVLLAVTTLAFDIAALELWLPLSVGARLEVVGREVAAAGAALGARLTGSGATVMQATPATWRLLVEAGWRGHPGFKILCGGEALPAGLARELRRGGASLWNLYGPTEATIWCTAHPVTTEEDPVPIGRPIQNVHCHVLDGGLEPVPIGVPGDLHVGGLALARGYLNRPELTAERFVRDPFSSDPRARLYRTGDLARYRSDGVLEFLGRLDHQVKLRGFRIEPGEIEAALATHPSVASAVVVLRASPSGDPRLVAYVTPRDGGRPDPRRLQESLRHQLPDYMVPTAFVVLDRLPLTANGKLDRAALPDPDRIERPDVEGYVAPRTPMEALLAEIWGELLGVERISVRDNFFDLGGHSLLAMRTIARVEKRGGCRLAPGDLIFQTLEQVARLCEARLVPPPASPRSGVLDRVRHAIRRALPWP